VPRWYGVGARVIEVATGTALWYHSGRPPMAIRWVLIRDPQQSFAPQALLCTDPDVAALQIVSWFVLRWQLHPEWLLRYCWLISADTRSRLILRSPPISAELGRAIDVAGDIPLRALSALPE
jgi:hypothetical protein